MKSNFIITKEIADGIIEMDCVCDSEGQGPDLEIMRPQGNPTEDHHPSSIFQSVPETKWKAAFYSGNDEGPDDEIRVREIRCRSHDAVHDAN